MEKLDERPEVKVFLSIAKAIENGVRIVRTSAEDKEFSFQNWVGDRIAESGLKVESRGRITYPDFVLTEYPIGIEVKGLGFDGARKDFDCNSQMPLAEHHGRKMFYIFGRYPNRTTDKEIVVYDLVMCTASFLNADSSYVHKNKNIKGFASYGDIMIRDRKMYVCRTPFTLIDGTQRQVTLVLDDLGDATSKELSEVGELTRVESSNLIVGYSFDLRNNKLEPQHIPNPNSGKQHKFRAYKGRAFSKQAVTLKEHED